MARTTRRSECKVCIAIKTKRDRHSAETAIALFNIPYPLEKMPIIVPLAIARKDCNLTQQGLAQLSDRSQQLIGKLEQGKAKGIGFETLEHLCRVTDRQTGDIIVYISNDPRLLDDTLTSLAKKWNCSTEEIWPCLPDDLKRAYRQWTLI